MKTIRLFSRLMLFGILVAMLMILTQSSALAGAGIEPGGDCDLEGLKYDPPPYIGELTAEFDTSTSQLILSGTVVQVGNSACTGTIKDFTSTITQPEFENITANYLRTLCVTNTLNEDNTLWFNCADEDAPFEILGVGNLKWIVPGEKFSAKFILMLLQ